MLRTEQTETIENFVCLPACSVRKSFTAIFATEHEPVANHPWPVRGGGNRESSCFREFYLHAFDNGMPGRSRV